MSASPWDIILKPRREHKTLARLRRDPTKTVTMALSVATVEMLDEMCAGKSKRSAYVRALIMADYERDPAERAGADVERF